MPDISQHVIEMILTIVLSVFSSSGFWLFVQTKAQKNDNQTKMLLGLAHDRLISLGMEYVSRGWLTDDEYENYDRYLYQPYKDLGGNGTGDRIKKQVDTLRLYKNYCAAQKAGEEMKGSDYCENDQQNI